MKKLLFILTFLFFATQIIPIKYIGYLCKYEVCYIDNNNDVDDDEESPVKLKEKAEKEVYFTDFLNQYTITKSFSKSANPYTLFCIKIPKEYIQKIIVPPPNC